MRRMHRKRLSIIDKIFAAYMMLYDRPKCMASRADLVAVSLLLLLLDLASSALSAGYISKQRKALIVVDVQDCFLPGGALPTEPSNTTETLIRNINMLRTVGTFDTVVFTQDWHPLHHISFAQNYNKQPQDLMQLQYTQGGQLCNMHDKFPEISVQCCNTTSTVTDGGSGSQLNNATVPGVEKQQEMLPRAEHTVYQVLWPDHCIQHTTEARLHPGLMVKPTDILLRKGHQQHLDAYSAFQDNGRVQSTGLASALRKRGIGSVVVAGVALDYCVMFTALDAVDEGFDTTVVLDATAPVNEEGAAHALAEFEQNGVRVVETAWDVHVTQYWCLGMHSKNAY